MVSGSSRYIKLAGPQTTADGQDPKERPRGPRIKPPKPTVTEGEYELSRFKPIVHMVVEVSRLCSPVSSKLTRRTSTAVASTRISFPTSKMPRKLLQSNDQHRLSCHLTRLSNLLALYDQQGRHGTRPLRHVLLIQRGNSG